jgi:antitoxin CptB
MLHAPAPDRPDPPRTARRGRILYRATHRGTKEADRLVGGFVAACIDRLTAAELDDLEAVLEFSDIDLTEWLTGRRPIPPDADSPMLRALREGAGR